MEWPRISDPRRRFLVQASRRYQAALADSEDAQVYLKERGITGEVAAAFQLGYVSDPLDGHENFHGYLSFPYRSSSGPTGIRFRRVGDDETKKRWLAETGVKDPLYNVLDLHKPEPYIAICEGQTDTITMSGMVGVPSVGISGAGKWEPYWHHLFVDYEEVFVMTDPDKAGDNAARKLLERLGHNARHVRLPADVNTSYLESGSDFIKGKLFV
jgi:DNA primase